MEQANLMMVAIFIALGFVLVAGLVVIPAVEEAQASLCKIKDGVLVCKDKKPKHNT